MMLMNEISQAELALNIVTL